jgi:hypothetical protein
LLSRVVVRIPFLCWLIVSLLLMAALANPETSRKVSYVKALSKEAMVSIDASHSMGYGKEHSTMARIKEVLHYFARIRMEKGDRLGVSAYGGHRPGNERGTGYARVIQYPTDDPQVAEVAIDALRTRMFGSYSATGDGLLVSINALIEQQAESALRGAYDSQRMEEALWSMGTGREDLSYPLRIVRALKRQEGRYVVLFADGKYNAGLHPAKVLWLAELLGMKVHFIAFESAGGTGLSPAEQRAHKREITEAVARTGGIYLESSDVEGVERLFRVIDRAEKAEITIKEDLRKISHRSIFLYLAAMAFCIWLLSWSAWGEPV